MEINESLMKFQIETYLNWNFVKSCENLRNVAIETSINSLELYAIISDFLNFRKINQSRDNTKNSVQSKNTSNVPTL